MKTNKLILNLSALVLAAGFIAGCASSGYEKAADTAASLTKSAEMITKGNDLIDVILGSLNDLVNNPQPDLRKQFEVFNSSVNKLTSTAKDVSSKTEGMKDKGAGYFAQWDKQMAAIQNEDIRNRSEARKNAVSAKFDCIRQNYDETKASFQPFMSDLRDVQKFLSTDLTAGGLVVIKDVAVKANKDAVPVKASLTKLADNFKSLGISMSPTTGK